MKNLFLIRHSKSSWDVPVQDINRSISARGVKDAHLIASKSVALVPNSYIVWCSKAKRTTETAYIFSEYLSIPIETIYFSEDLYTFDEKKLHEIIKKCKNEHDNLILFGHNEAITNFVNKFGDLNIENVPTSGLVAMQFNTEDWQNIGKGKTIATLFPSHFKNE
ncbi:MULTISPECIES: histidine phosphatase family protein [unclassified Flavobacterium]|uniref:SixA phosphatase family protein n=1 Tax=unclassified Flavobacterium TaxID=196869 RepID=UPI00129128F1|nr:MULTISPECIES: histidine phosphatase family protein [unclassified Flavobacterium]MQP52320.1 histidine phosphatase family protein [Flavobacterium sp. LMO9]MQP62390.1 histidine phosphatase family protein [Flavobacterium sp. LMO6]